MRDWFVPSSRSVADGWMCGRRILRQPHGRFVVGGPDGDAGRPDPEIIVDTYGNAMAAALSPARIDQVDRSATYFPLLAKNGRRRFGQQVHHSVALPGVSKPLSFYVNTHETGQADEAHIVAALELVDMIRAAFANIWGAVRSTLGRRLTALRTRTEADGVFRRKRPIWSIG